MITFLFYTYDTSGHDLIVKIEAGDRDEAWARFDHQYVEDCPVDSVIIAGTQYQD